MKNFLLLLVLSHLAIGVAFAQTDAEVHARSEALELGGAFSNDGFKIRDGHWSGSLESNGSLVVAVNLYAANEYWFCTAGTGAPGLKIEVFNEVGEMIDGDRFEDVKTVEEGADVQRSALGVTIPASGQYFLRVSIDESPGPATCSLIYLYK